MSDLALYEPYGCRRGTISEQGIPGGIGTFAYVNPKTGDFMAVNSRCKPADKGTTR